MTSTPWPFGDLTPLRYRVIMADPAWMFALRSPKGEAKSPQAHYRCMPLADIQALPMLPQALATLNAWGFTFKSAGAWAKQSPTGASWAFGPGYIYRSAAEFWLLGTIGRPAQRSRSIRNLIVAPRREHSRKPDEMHTDIEALFDGPYVELFARSQRPGWDCWGNETTKFEAAA